MYLLGEVLNNLPESLDETYKRILDRIHANSYDYAKQMLTFLCYAKRPLTLCELTDAMAVDPEHGLAHYQERKLTRMSIQEICPGFVELVEEPSTGEQSVHIAHSSVQQYLESSRLLCHEKIKLFTMNREESHTRIAKTCLIFLLDPTFATSVDAYPILKYAATYWPHHQLEGSKSAELEYQIQQLFRDPNGLFENWVGLCDITQLPDSPKGHMGHHLLSKSPLTFAAFLGFHSLVQMLLDDISWIPDHYQDKQFRSAPDETPLGIYGCALQAAASTNRVSIVQLFLDRKFDFPIRDDEWWRAVYATLESEHEDVAKLLRDNNVFPDGNHPDCAFTFDMAMNRGHETAVHFILDNCINVHSLLNKASYRARVHSPLRRAMGDGDEKTIRLLLEKGARIDVPFYECAKIPLFEVARGKNVGALRLLIDHSPDVNINILGEDGSTALMHSNTEEVTSILLDRGANAQIQDQDGKTALMHAVEQGNTGVARLLINKGAGLDIQDFRDETALFKASARLDEKMVQLLLDADANVHLNDRLERSPLMIAIWPSFGTQYENLRSPLSSRMTNESFNQWHHRLPEFFNKWHHHRLPKYNRHWNQEVVRLLLDKMPDIYLRSIAGFHALEMAERLGQQDVVQMIIDAAYRGICKDSTACMVCRQIALLSTLISA